MSEITAIRTKRGRHSKKVAIFVDGRLAFSLDTEVADKQGLQIGRQLSSDQIEALAESDNLQRCYAAAARFLHYRPRSEAELRALLRQRGFDDESIAAVTAKLKKQGLIDDAGFARFWKENRDYFKPRSRRLIRQELRQKGIANDVVEQITGNIDDGEMAYRAALGKSHRLPLTDRQVFQRRLGEYLRRRGFDYEAIKHAVDKLWCDLTAQSDDS